MAARTETTKQTAGDIQQTPPTGPMTNAARFSFTGPRIYLGPTDTKKGLRFGMGFKGGLPAEVAAMCERCPSIFALIVPPSEVTACREKLTVKGSAQHQALETIEKFIRGGE